MSHYHIFGGIPLHGETSVGGCKNAVLPILFATLLTRGENILENVPRISDVECVLDILRSLDVRVSYLDLHTLLVDATDASPSLPNSAAVRRIRASTYLIGSMLARFGSVTLQSFGGCSFCERPIDLHLLAARAFGAGEEGDVLSAPALHAADLTLPLISVGATVNALLMAASIEKCSVISGVAIEPHVLALVHYLRMAGAEIRIRSYPVPTFFVRGGRLSGVRIRMIPDMIEAGTLLLAAAITGGTALVHRVDPSHLQSLLEALSLAGAEIDKTEDSVRLTLPKNAAEMHLVAAPYPGIATDLSPLLCALLARLGTGSMRDTVFPERRSFLDAYHALGANFALADASIRFFAPSEPRRRSVSVPDLRAGAGTVLLALAGAGEAILTDENEYISRGYENFKGKLQMLGAHIE